MKRFAFLVALLALVSGLSAQSYFTRTGHIWFFSHTPAEDIEAHNYQVLSQIKPDGSLQFAMLMKGFEFEKALMQEHFNEKYVESDKFPKAGFKGKITNLDQIDLSKDGTYPTKVAGEMTIHGVTKPVQTEGTIEVKEGKAVAKAKFSLKPTDYDITLFSSKIAEVLDIHVDMNYQAQDQ